MARDRLAAKLSELAAQLGEDRVGKAIDSCLDDSPFVPDISEIRKALGLTGAQKEKASSSDDAVQASDAWMELVAYLKRYATNDVNGRWYLRPVSRNKLVDGDFVFIEDGKGGRQVVVETLPMPKMPERSEWCMNHIGGIGRIRDCDERYVEIVRKEFLKAWPLYVVPRRMNLDAGSDEAVDISALLSTHGKMGMVQR